MFKIVKRDSKSTEPQQLSEQLQDLSSDVSSHLTGIPMKNIEKVSPQISYESQEFRSVPKSESKLFQGLKKKPQMNQLSDQVKIQDISSLNSSQEFQKKEKPLTCLEYARIRLNYPQLQLLSNAEQKQLQDLHPLRSEEIIQSTDLKPVSNLFSAGQGTQERSSEDQQDPSYNQCSVQRQLVPTLKPEQQLLQFDQLHATTQLNQEFIRQHVNEYIPEKVQGDDAKILSEQNEQVLRKQIKAEESTKSKPILLNENIQVIILLESMQNQAEKQESEKEEQLPQIPIQYPEEQKQSILEQISIEKNNLKSELTKIFMNQYAIIQQQKKLKSKIFDLTQTKASLAESQTEMAQNDQFSEAQNLEEHIEIISEEIAQNEKEVTQIKQEYLELNLEKDRLYIKEVQLTEKWISALSESCQQKLSEREKFQILKSSELKREQENIEEHKEKLKISFDLLSVDRKHLEENQEEITKNLKNQTHELTQQSENLSAKKLKLGQEIAALRKRLAFKEDSFENVSTKLGRVNEKISEISLDYEGDLKIIETKKVKLRNDHLKWGEEKAELDRLISKNAADSIQMEEKLNRFESELINFQTLRNQISETILELKQQHKDRETVANRFTNANARLIECENLLEDCAKSFKSLVGEQQHRDSIVVELKNKIKSIVEKLPNLEKDKKAFVSQKKFNKAADISLEIKQITNEMEKANKMIEKCQQEAGIKENMLLDIQAKKEVSQKELKSLQRLVDIEKQQLLSFKLNDLRRLSQFNNSEISQNSYENEILKAEIKLIEEELVILAQSISAPENLTVNLEEQKEEIGQEEQNEAEGFLKEKECIDKRLNSPQIKDQMDLDEKEEKDMDNVRDSQCEINEESQINQIIDLEEDTESVNKVESIDDIKCNNETLIQIKEQNSSSQNAEQIEKSFEQLETKNQLINEQNEIHFEESQQISKNNEEEEKSIGEITELFSEFTNEVSVNDN